MRTFDVGDVALSLEELKVQMSVDIDDTYYDAHIEMLGRVALSQVVSMTARTVDELKEMGGGEFPEDLRLAALQIAAHWFRVRESVSSVAQNPVPYGLETLVKKFARLGVRND